MALGLYIGVLLALCGLVYLIAADKAERKVSEAGNSPQIYQPRYNSSELLLPEWKDIIQAYVPVVAKMPRNRRAELYCLTMRFMNEKKFIGRNGLTVSDRMAVTIASQACLLLLGREHAFYPTLKEVHVFPRAFSAPGHENLLIGASFIAGPVVLSWDDSLLGLYHPHDGHNVVLHEFAHQLDQETGLYNGTPIFEDYNRYAIWQKAMENGFRRLKGRVAANVTPVINPYGTVGLEEFFAVSTEAFFEIPKDFYTSYPRVYEELRDYYKLDPLLWV